MIRLRIRSSPPAPLRDDGATARERLVAAVASGEEALSFDRTVYAAPEVKQALCDDQHGKCAFCESLVRHVAYGDVEHFRPKAAYRADSGHPLRRPGYYWLAYDWSNLVFACELCNRRHKANLFPLADETRRAGRGLRCSPACATSPPSRTDWTTTHYALRLNEHAGMTRALLAERGIDATAPGA